MCDVKDDKRNANQKIGKERYRSHPEYVACFLSVL